MKFSHYTFIAFQFVVAGLLFPVSFVHAEGSGGVFKKSDAPTIITSDTLDLDTKTRDFVYTGNVVVVQDDMKLVCDKLIGSYDANNQIQSLSARLNVIITKGADIKAESQRADYDPKTEVMKLTENPSLIRGGSELRSEVIKIFLRTEKTLAEGKVQMKVLEKDASSQASK
jgi:lipopolysaccharide export system protein LptA